jgi:RNA polymerase sigma factor (sigma-70 family)
VTRRDRDGAADAELVAAARSGDKTAFGDLVVRHRPMAVGVCTRFLDDADLATDVVQEAVVVALVELARLSDAERFGSWLCGIALNLARQRLRRRHRLAEVPLDSFGPATAGLDHGSDPADPADLAEQAATRARVRRAIAGLAPGQREAVLLFYLQGLTHREVAAELDISVNAVKARLHQARTALEPRLADDVEIEVRPARKEPAMTVTSDAHTDMRVREVRRSPDADGDGVARRHVIVLEEREGERCLPIWVGPAEATALALELEDVALSRPLTYRFTASLLAATGARVEEVQVTRLHEGTFYAVVVVVTGSDRHEVDARPSDAINLAVTADAPIKVDPALLELDETAAGAERLGWRDYEVAGAAIAAETRTVIDEQRRRLSEPGSP